MSTERTALVTGTTKGGLGDYLARELHSRGFRVFATVRTHAKGEHLKALGIETIMLDVAVSESIHAAAAEVGALTGGRLDMLVNNSGVGYQSALLDADLTAARAVFDVNVFGLLEVTQAFSPLLIASKGRVVNIGSVVGRVPIPFQGLYNASKAALEHISCQMRIELKPFDIKVIHVITGGIKTDFFAHAGKDDFPETSPYRPGRDHGLLPWITADAQVPQQKTLPNKYAKSVINKVLKSSPSSVIWVGYGAFETRIIAGLLWRNATDILLHVIGLPDMKKAIAAGGKSQ